MSETMHNMMEKEVKLDMEDSGSSSYKEMEIDEMVFSNYLLPMRMMTDEEEHQVRVEFFTNERSFKEKLQLYFIKNQRSSLHIRLFNFMIKILTCVLYVIRVCLDDPTRTKGCCHICKNHTWKPVNSNDDLVITKVHWELIFFVNRSHELWIIQVVVAILSLSQSCLTIYLGYKGNILHSVFALSFLLECLNTVPFIITTFKSEKLQCLFLPVFLNCWLAKIQLEDVFSDLNRVLQRTSSALSHRVMKVMSTTICLIFTSVCGVQHLQRGGYRHFTLFESLWFVVVTFSTVGYGDYKPDIWPSQVFMICMILVSIIVIPTQLEKMAYVWIERNKLGGTYSRHRAQTEKHVVVCTTALKSDTIMDFLNEFYAHPKLQAYYVCLLSPCELDSTMKMILQVPIWAQRVIYIQGSALKDLDLARCRMQDSEACFILAPNTSEDFHAADQHTVMRSWAVKDFAPQCPQYVQLYRPENKIHVRFAEHVVCEDEFKYALLGNNTLVPGVSTLVTLLIHTSRGQEGQTSSEEWQRLYGKCSGNEVYHIKLEESGFFKEYLGKPFSYASYHAHRKYGVSLVAISSPKTNNIQLNPGPRHVMDLNDTCFYLSITKEENSSFIINSANSNVINANEEKELNKHSTSLKESFSNDITLHHFDLSPSRSYTKDTGKIAKEEFRQYLSRSSSFYSPIKSGSRSPRRNGSHSKLLIPMSINDGSMRLHCPRGSIAPVSDTCADIQIQIQSLDQPDGSEELDYIKGCPPAVPYVGTSPCLCHLMRKKRSLCCLQLIVPCEHCPYQNVADYQWSCRSVIVCADTASYGLYNFIVPLRSHWRSKRTLKPIILLVETQPDTYFLESLSYFPLVYWMQGSNERLDDLLKAGITIADNVVVVNKESSNSAEEDTLSDCNTIIAVQTIYRLFPHVTIITEISQSSNMRFTLFSPDDKYALSMSKFEKKERARGSHISYIFRLPFAAGNVFSANMLDTLLYQAFVKSYLIKFVRLLLGIDQAVGSGHLTCYQIKKEDMWIKTYGRLYQHLCGTTCEIPIGIYRTIRREKTDVQALVSVNKYDNFLSRDDKFTEKSEISQIVKCRLLTLGLQFEGYDQVEENCNPLSFVIINPNYDLALQKEDVIYLLCPSSLSNTPSPLIDERKNLEDKSRSMLNINKTENDNFSAKYASNFSQNSTQSLYTRPQKVKSPLEKQKFFLETPQNSIEKDNHDMDNAPLLKVVTERMMS